MATDSLPSDEDLRAILLTVDGKGRAAKEAALIELLKRANAQSFRDHEGGCGDSSLAAIVSNAQQSMRRRDPCTCTRSGYEGFPCPVHSP